MENMSEALILGFSVLIFVIALTISMSMFAMARSTSDFVLHRSDKTNYYTYDRFADENEVEESKERIVGIEDIVPTLYRYYKENYRVEFYYIQNNELKEIEIYKSKMTNPQTSINYLDVEDEIARHEPWTGSQEKFKQNLDALLSGGRYNYPNNSDYYEYNPGLIEVFNGKRFREVLVKTTISQASNDTENEEKITIKYIVE